MRLLRSVRDERPRQLHYAKRTSYARRLRRLTHDAHVDPARSAWGGLRAPPGPGSDRRRVGHHLAPSLHRDDGLDHHRRPRRCPLKAQRLTLGTEVLRDPEVLGGRMGILEGNTHGGATWFHGNDQRTRNLHGNRSIVLTTENSMFRAFC